MGVLPSAGWSGRGGDRGRGSAAIFNNKDYTSLNLSGSSGLRCIHISLWNPFACAEEGREEGSSSPLFSMSSQSSERLPHLVPGSIQSQCRLFTPTLGCPLPSTKRQSKGRNRTSLFLRATLKQSSSSLALRE